MAFAQTTALPPGIQESGVIAGSAREQLATFINDNYEAMKSGSIAQQRAARDNLLGMFDAPSVSTAFRQTASSLLAPHIEESIASRSRWDRFAGFRLAAKLATEDSARWFSHIIGSTEDIEKSDMLMALGQVRVMFLEADIGGLAVSQATLSRLGDAIGRELTETDDPDIGLLQARALRALAQGTRVELKDAHNAAAQALALAMATRYQSQGSVAPGGSPRDIDRLLVDLEAMDAIRGYLVMRNATEAMPDPVAKALGQFAGQTLAYISRTYESTPASADATRRYLQTLAQRSIEMTSILVVDFNIEHQSRPLDVKGVPAPNQMARWLAGSNMQKFKLGTIQTLDILARAYGFEPSPGWAKID